MKCVKKQFLFLPKEKEIANIEERDEREREERNEAFNHEARWASQRPRDPSSSSVPAQVTQPGLQDSNPTSAMRPAVYYPSGSVGNPLTNENSPLPIDLESGEFSGLRSGLYKPAIQPLSTTLGPSLLRRTARTKHLPHLPGLLRRAARIPGPGQGLSTPFSHAATVLTSVLM